MKFLTISTVKDVFYTLPQAEQNRLTKSTIEFTIDVMKKMGDKFHLYVEVGWGRPVSIGEYGSVEEYQQSLQTPMAQAGYVNWETYPLIEYDVKAAEAMLASYKAAK